MSDEAVAEAKGAEGVPAKSNVTSIETAQRKRSRQKLELAKLLQDIALTDTSNLDLSAMEIIEAEQFLDRAARLPAAYDTTISEAIVKHFAGHVSEIPGIRTTIKDLRATNRTLTNPKPDKVRTAKRQDFYELFETVLGPLRRDIFSGDLMYRGPEGLWTGAENELEVLASESAVFEEEGVCKFRRGDLLPHFKSFERSKTPELLCEIPPWDKRDRVKEIAQALVLDGTQADFTQTTCEEFIKAWLGGVFRRLEDPRFQNPVLIFTGPQGVGKDWLTDALSDGIGQWADHLELSGNHKDDYGQLSEALIFRIGEFDKMAQTDQARLKDMIFRPKTGLRAAYERKKKNRQVRCSFIASTNNHDIYKDSTGHRRYWPINLAKVEWNYPRSKEDSLQIMAQARELAAERYEPSKESLKAMAAFIEERTPESIEDNLAEHWFLEIREWMNRAEDPGIICDVRERGWITVVEARKAGVIGVLMKHHGISERYLCSKLAARGLRRRNTKNKGYLCAPTVINDRSLETSVIGNTQQSSTVIF